MLTITIATSVAGFVVCLGSIVGDVVMERGPFRKHGIALANSGLALVGLSLLLLLVAT